MLSAAAVNESLDSAFGSLAAEAKSAASSALNSVTAYDAAERERAVNSTGPSAGAESEVARIREACWLADPRDLTFFKSD